MNLSAPPATGWSSSLAQDVEDPSLLVPAVDVWHGHSPFGPHAVEDLLRELGRLARLAPELVAALDERAPDVVAVPGAAVMEFVHACAW